MKEGMSVDSKRRKISGQEGGPNCRELAGQHRKHLHLGSGEEYVEDQIDHFQRAWALEGLRCVWRALPEHLREWPPWELVKRWLEPLL